MDLMRRLGRSAVATGIALVILLAGCAPLTLTEAEAAAESAVDRYLVAPLDGLAEVTERSADMFPHCGMGGAPAPRVQIHFNYDPEDDVLSPLEQAWSEMGEATLTRDPGLYLEADGITYQATVTDEGALYATVNGPCNFQRP